MYEITILDGSKRQVTNSTVESYFASGYVPGTAKMCYEADKGGNEIYHVFLLNEDGTSQDLTPGEKEKAHFGGWSKDKKSMYYISNKRDPRFFDLNKMKIGEWIPEMIYQNNEGKEFTYLIQYEIETGAKGTIFETNWDVSGSYLSENEKYRVISINEDEKNALIVKENSTGINIDFPPIPDGNVLNGRISDSENKMLLTVGTSRTPGNIYVYNLGTREMKKLTETLNPEINLEDLASAKVIHFRSFDELEIPAIFYKPLTASKNTRANSVRKISFRKTGMIILLIPLSID